MRFSENQISALLPVDTSRHDGYIFGSVTSFFFYVDRDNKTCKAVAVIVPTNVNLKISHNCPIFPHFVAVFLISNAILVITSLYRGVWQVR